MEPTPNPNPNPTPAPAPDPQPAPAPAPAPAPEPAPQPFNSGGNVTSGPWYKSVNWLEAGLVTVGLIAGLTVIHYHRLKIKNLKSEIPAVKSDIEEMKNMVGDLQANKVDKKKGGQGIGLGGLQ